MPVVRPPIDRDPELIVHAGTGKTVVRAYHSDYEPGQHYPTNIDTYRSDGGTEGDLTDDVIEPGDVLPDISPSVS